MKIFIGETLSLHQENPKLRKSRLKAKVLKNDLIDSFSPTYHEKKLISASKNNCAIKNIYHSFLNDPVYNKLIALNFRKIM